MTATTSRAPLRLLYIDGGGRSGSTLLLRLLGQLPGALPVGELYHLWDWALSEALLCGCGQPVADCPFWSRVLVDAYGEAGPDVARMRTLMHSFEGYRYLPLLLSRRLRDEATEQRFREYSDGLRALYGAIGRQSGARLVIDSSKNPWYALVLARLPEVEVHVVQVVRDSRAVAYSWQRRKERPEVQGERQYMSRYGPLRAALKWNLANGFGQLLPVAGLRHMVLRYEDLVADPRGSLLRVGAHLDEEWSAVDFFDENAPPAPNHTVAGNPNRFESGPIRIRPDDEWSRRMKPRDRAVVTALTAPLLLRYGYRPGTRPAGVTEQEPDSRIKRASARPESGER